MADDSVLNEYGISGESIESFAKRNDYPAAVKYPQDLTTGRDVKKAPIPFLPIDNWIETEDWDQMLFEAKRLQKHYIPHRHHENHRGWSSLVLHGLSSVHTESCHTYGFTDADAPWRWTDVADWCPTITNFLQSKLKYNKYFRIRIMKLAPGGFVIPHKDSLSLLENHVGPVNIAINHPEECKFYMDNIGYLPWKQGRAITLNLYNVHAVFNNSNEDRYHLIVHGHIGPNWLDEVILHNYNNWKNIYA